MSVLNKSDLIKDLSIKLSSIEAKKIILYISTPPKSHDLEQLIEICKENKIGLVDNIEILIEFSDYDVEGRYSIIHDDLNESNKFIIIKVNS